jgi:hypothetical protein
MVLHHVSAQDEVPHQTGVVRYLVIHPEGAVETQGGSITMVLRADSANSLGDYGGITGVSAPHHYFYATEHVTGTAGFLNLPGVNHSLNLEVTFNSGYRVNYYFSHYLASLSSVQYAPITGSSTSTSFS